MSSVESLQSMLDKGMDNALLRYSLGNAYFGEKNYEKSIEHFRIAIEHDPDYSAAWKLLGRSYIALARTDEAAETLEKGIAVAAKKGDKQAEKEMTVFLRKALRTK